jgi:hypothetical protein
MKVWNLTFHKKSFTNNSFDADSTHFTNLHSGSNSVLLDQKLQIDNSFKWLFDFELFEGFRFLAQEIEKLNWVIRSNKSSDTYLLSSLPKELKSEEDDDHRRRLWRRPRRCICGPVDGRIVTMAGWPSRQDGYVDGIRLAARARLHRSADVQKITYTSAISHGKYFLFDLVTTRWGSN